MPSLTAIPTATGTYTQWTVAAGSRPTLAQANDGNTSYAQTSAATKKDSYAMTDLASEAVSVTSVTGKNYVRRQDAGAGDGRHLIRTSATDAVSSVYSYLLGSYGLQSTAWATDGAGAAWTVSGWNSTECGLRHEGSGVEVRYTQIFAEVVYVAGGGGFIHLLADVLLPILGAAVPLSAMSAMATRAGALTRNLILPGEYRQAHAELVGYTRPVYSF